jgi:hypothetical protein
MSRSVAQLVGLFLLGSLLLVPAGAGGSASVAPAPHSLAPASPAAPPPIRSTGPTPPARATPDQNGALPPSHRLLGHIPAPAGPRRSLLPPDAVVNPYMDYSVEPAPMGVGDFGVDANDAAYTYSTSRFLGTAHIGSLSTTDSFGDCWSSFQLNVVLGLHSGSNVAALWIQDVPFVCYSNGTFQVVDNVWNLSSTTGAMNAHSVSGNGTVYASGTAGVYEDEASNSYAGIGANLVWPSNFSAEVVEGDLSGTTYVDFLYNDGYGWVGYDNVTFPWTQGWTDDGFVVNGGAYTPLGIFYDAEWDFAGPGGGSTVDDVSSNVSMSLDYYNGHNFESVPNAYNFGSDTGESAENVVAALDSTGSPGTPAAVLTPGSGSLHTLYWAGDLATVSARPSLTDGALGSRGAPTNYTGGAVNLTVVPGSYRFTLWNGSTLVASVRATLSAGAYQTLAFPTLTFNATQGYPARKLTATGSGFPANAQIAILWPGNSSQDCSATASSSGAFQCTLRVPYAAAGAYVIPATANDTGAESGYAAFRVLSNLTVTIAGATAYAETTEPVRFWANASLGYPPYQNYLWNWGDGTTNTTQSGAVVHAFVVSGTLRVNVSVEDRLGTRVGAETTLRIAPSTTALVSASPASVDVGQSATFSATASFGFPPYNFSWENLPPGCPEYGTTLLCPDLSTLGTYPVSVVVNDSHGVVVTSAPWRFTVSADPEIQTVAYLAPYTDVGQTLTLEATPEGGTAPLTYHWNGMPGGCQSATSRIDCAVSASGNFPVVVTATDAAGLTTAPYALNVTIATDPVVHVGFAFGDQVALGEPIEATATVTGGSGTVSFFWTNLPTGCGSANSSTLDCVASERGTFFVNATVTDRAGFLASGVAELEVLPKVAVSWVLLPRAQIDLGANLSLGAAASGGIGEFRYAWTGLPPGCPSENASFLTCRPTETGTFRISASASDAGGELASTANVSVTIDPDPAILSLGPTHRPIVEGAAVAFSALTTGGSGGFAYSWSGLPPGCTPSNNSTVACVPTASGTFTIDVIVEDSSGGRAQASIQATVVASFLGLDLDQEIAVFAGIALIAALAVGAMLLGRRGMRKGASAPGAKPKAAPPKPVRRAPPRPPRLGEDDWGDPDEPL